MRNPVEGAQFRRDVKLAQKRNKDMALAGDWKHFRDCHIEPDWLLIYKIDDDDLQLVRTGTHSDLFRLDPRLAASRRCTKSCR